MRIFVPPGEVISNAAWPSHCTPMGERFTEARPNCADAVKAVEDRLRASSAARAARRAKMDLGGAIIRYSELTVE